MILVVLINMADIPRNLAVIELNRKSSRLGQLFIFFCPSVKLIALLKYIQGGAVEFCKLAVHRKGDKKKM